MPPLPDLELSTSRVRLRPLSSADLDAVHALWTDPLVRRYLWDNQAIAREQALEVLVATDAHFRERRYGLWGVFEAASDAIMGFVGCRPWPSGEPELLYGLVPAWWGQGYATEASHAVLTYVFETLGHRVVFAATDPPNLASVRVMARLGMTFDRRTEMHGLETLVYRLSRERWRTTRNLGDNRLA